MLRKEFIQIGLDCKDAQDAIETLAKLFVNGGVVKESFVKAVLEREKVYPTGLPAVAFDIAIPHTISDHVLEPAMAIGVLEHPVEFSQMGSPEIILHPQILFLLAIRDPKEQTDLLRRIMKLLQNEQLLCSVKNAKSPEDIMQLLIPELEQ